MNANIIYNENGIAAQKFMDETERMASAKYNGNGIAAEQYMEETATSSSLMCQECGNKVI